jgi:hypothetical protein
MSIYDEAIEEAKQIQRVAEDNARRAVIDAVTPRIKALIERRLTEDVGDVQAVTEPVLATSDPAAAITPPGPDGKMTLDLDALSPPDDPLAVMPTAVQASPGDDFVLNAESIAALGPLVAASSKINQGEVELMTYRLGETIARFERAGRTVKNSRGFKRKIVEMKSRVRNTYECVQESVSDPAKRRALEQKLEAFDRALGRLTESQMSKNRRTSHVNEGDVTLKLTGLPDELDLDTIGVDLVQDEGGDDDGDGDAALDLDDDGDGGAGGGDELDLDGGDGSKEMGEGRRLSDNTVVEIDEGMLRREIRRMRRINEDAVPSTKGHAPRGAELDDFGGGGDEGDAWIDSDLPHGADKITVVGEADGADDEVLEIDMGDGESVAECDDMPMESRRLSSSRRHRSLRETARRARVSGDRRKFARTSVALGRAAHTQRGGQRSVTESRQRAAIIGKNSALQQRLDESNLQNAKLLATTRLLQNDALSAEVRADIAEQLDRAQTPREVKLVYESLTRTLGRSGKQGSTSVGVRGSASRTARSASSVLTEGHEASRWAQLAGIKG